MVHFSLGVSALGFQGLGIKEAWMEKSAGEQSRDLLGTGFRVEDVGFRAQTRHSPPAVIEHGACRRLPPLSYRGGAMW